MKLNESIPILNHLCEKHGIPMIKGSDTHYVFAERIAALVVLEMKSLQDQINELAKK
jgi:hypothetical protein